MVDFEELKGKIRGPAVLVMAPFAGNDELNVEALQDNIQFIMDGGIGGDEDGVIICPCGNGEYMTLSPEERKRMVEAAVEVGGDELPVIAGIGSCNYKEVIRLSLDAAEAGAECVMIPPPFYYRISQEGIYRWYKIIADATKEKIGIMAYSHPWRLQTGGGISVQLMGKLAEIESIVTFKWGAESVNAEITALSLYSKRFALLANSTIYAREMPHVLGEVGFVSGIGAFWPELEAEYWSLLEQHKYEESFKLNAKMAPYFEFIAGRGGGEPGIEGPFALFIASVMKTALEYVGLYGGSVRPPFVDLTKEQKECFFGILEGIGVPRKE